MRVVRSDDHRDHHCLELDGGQLIPSWESPVRADRVAAAFAEAGYEDVVGPDALDDELVRSVHDPDYLAFLASAWEQWVADGYEGPAAMGFAWPARRFGARRPETLAGQLGFHSFAADCSIGPATWQAASTSAAIAQSAADVVTGGARSAFALCRPPGHHATLDQFGGYCFVNNAAVAAQRLLDGGAARVAILDVDYHHGNGTQDIFYGRSDVAFCSLHADPRHEFPYFLGHEDEPGRGAGLGSNRNYPLPQGTGIDQWLVALDDGLAWLRQRACDVVVVSLGVDTHVDDPISHFTLTTADYPTVGDRIATLGLPTVFILEGGYATEVLGVNVVGVVDGFQHR